MADTTRNPGSSIAKTILVLMLFLDIFLFHQDVRVKYTVSILCPCKHVTIMTIVQKYQKGCLNRDFFLSQLHVGRDLGFSNKIGVISTKSEWLDSLG